MNGKVSFEVLEALSELVSKVIKKKNMLGCLNGMYAIEISAIDIMSNKNPQESIDITGDEELKKIIKEKLESEIETLETQIKELGE